jgi:arsenite-transporting ATPase
MYQEAVQALGNAGTTTLVLVTRPEVAALQEAQRTSGELSALGVTNQQLVVNGVFRASNTGDPIALAMEERGQRALAEFPSGLAALPRTEVPLALHGVLGVAALRMMIDSDAQETAPVVSTEPDTVPTGILPLSALVAEFAAAGRGVILTMGKGGVGKTTVAAAIAVALAEKGLAVHLSTTDPAAHIAATVNGSVDNLTLSRIDPRAEVADYSAEVMRTAGANLDEQGRALLAEDLRSPCTEEIAVFRAFARAVAAGEDRFVVLDTAPTGHTILLLDAALAYHREVTRQASGVPEAVARLLPRLRDPDFSKVLIVTLPEATPVHEAAHLQHDLRRAGIEPFGWVINQSLAPLTVLDPVLRSRQQQEVVYIREVVAQHARRVALIAWQSQPPVGVAGLRRILQQPQPVHS